MSLAAQLQILSGREKAKQGYVAKTPSFLFEERVAADTDNQTIYHIGINGLTELMQLDDRFAPFKQTLFGGANGSSGNPSRPRPPAPQHN